MWALPLPIWEKVLRAAVVFFFLLVGMRLTGRRQLGQMSSFDVVVLLLISNVVQNAMIGDDNSVSGGLIGATTLLLLNFGIARMVATRKWAARALEAGPTILIHNGHLVEANIRRELMSREELLAALRRQGILSIDEVHVALLEETGAITAIRRSPSPPKSPSTA